MKPSVIISFCFLGMLGFGLTGCELTQQDAPIFDAQGAWKLETNPSVTVATDHATGVQVDRGALSAVDFPTNDYNRDVDQWFQTKSTIGYGGCDNSGKMCILMISPTLSLVNTLFYLVDDGFAGPDHTGHFTGSTFTRTIAGTTCQESIVQDYKVVIRDDATLMNTTITQTRSYSGCGDYFASLKPAIENHTLKNSFWPALYDAKAIDLGDFENLGSVQLTYAVRGIRVSTTFNYWDDKP